MRYAIFSDLHGNRQAWNAVLADMEALEAQVYVCLGDVVGYGPCPQEVLDAVRACTANIVIGNHDAAACGRMDSTVFNPRARQVIEWTRDQLDEDSLKFLANLPLAIEAGRILFVHAEVERPGRFGYIEDARAAERNFAARDHFVTFIGHTHFPALFELQHDGTVLQLPDRDCELAAGRRYIVNVGSVGEPRQVDDLRARYVIYDSDRSMLFFRRIEFEPEAYRADWIQSGLESTPFFLRVIDQRRAEAEESLHAMGDAGEVEVATSEDPAPAMSELVLPSGIDDETWPEAKPVPRPTPARQPHHPKVALLLIPLLAVAAFVAVRRPARRAPDPAPFIVQADRSSHEEALRDLPVAPGTSGSEDIRAASDAAPSELVPPGPETPPDPRPAPPAVAPVAEVSLPLVEMVPAGPPAAAPEPDRARPPLAPLGLGKGLIFYATFDEAEGALHLHDRSSSGRDLEATGLSLGHPGRVGTAGRLEDPVAGLASTPQVLPKLTELTISLWIRRPAKMDGKEVKMEVGKDGTEAGVKKEGLVSIKDYCEVRLEGEDLVADLDLAGKNATVAYPRDADWHHVVVEHGPGITMIWIDNATPSLPEDEQLKATPVVPVEILIGSKGANFFLDEVAIWDHRFSPAERENLFRRGQAGAPLFSAARVIAHWSFDEEDGSKLFQDSVGDHELGTYKAWMPMEGVAPDPVPLTLKPNVFAAQVRHLGERPEKAGRFEMRPDAAFTYEGWVKFNGGEGGTLGGTVSEGAKPGEQGWRVAARRDRGANAFVGFIYETGSGSVQALARDVPVFDGFGHHFAAVWKPDRGTGQGAMQLFIDNAMVATADLPLAELDSGDPQPFRIEADRAPFTIDEVRFSEGALPPVLFLTAGIATHPWDDPNFEPGSVLERRDWELRRRRQMDREERERAEAARKVNGEQEKEADEARKKEEDAKRKERQGLP